LKYQPNEDGYLGVQLANKGVRKSYLVHRLVAECFIPNPKPLINNIVNHKDGNKQNNSIENLEWVTNSENVKHGVELRKKK
jgi:hypothetical protein